MSRCCEFTNTHFRKEKKKSPTKLGTNDLLTRFSAKHRWKLTTCGTLTLTHNFYGTQLHVDSVDKVLRVNTSHTGKKKKSNTWSQGARKYSRQQLWGWLNILEQESDLTAQILFLKIC